MKKLQKVLGDFIKQYWLPLILVVLLLPVLIAFMVTYCNHLKEDAYQQISDNVEYALEEKSNSVRMYIDACWDDADLLFDYLQNGENINGENAISVLTSRLASFAETYSYAHVGVLSQEGIFYDETGTLYPMESALFADCEEGECLSQLQTIGSSTYMMFGAYHSVLLGGMNIVGTILLSDVSDLNAAIDTYLWNTGKGDVCIVDSYGNFLLTSGRIFVSSATCQTLINFVDLHHYSLEDMTPNQLSSLIRKNKKTSLNCYNGYDESMILSICPISGCDWSTVGIVSRDLAYDLYHAAVVRFVWLIVGTVLGTICVFSAVYYALKHNTWTAETGKAKAMFMANINHELRVPMNAVISDIHQVMRHADNPELVRAHVQNAKDESQRALHLIEDMLTVSMSLSQRFTREWAPMSLDTLLDTVYATHKQMMEERGIRFGIVKHIDKPCISTNEKNLSLALSKVIENAARFTPGGGKVVVSVEQFPEPGHNITTKFVVEDSGCGMDETQIAHLFDAFGYDTIERPLGEKEVGISMSVCHSLIMMLGGTIEVKSAIGEGSVFTIMIPTPISSYRELAMSTMDYLEGENGPLNVLIVEDDDVSADSLEEALESVGFTTSRASSGQQAIDAFSASPIGGFDVILMDVQLPEMSGFKTAKVIRALGRTDAQTVKIIACTANTFDEDKNQAFFAGMNDLITKPIDMDKLLDQLLHLRVVPPEKETKEE